VDRTQEVTASRRLEPLGWRGTQRENAGDYEQMATAGKWALIASTVIGFQNKHGGASPTDLQISRDAKLTTEQVRYHLREMEKAGLIKDVKGWPRHIIVTNVAKVQQLAQLAVMPSVTGKVEEAKVEQSHEVQRVRRTISGRKPFVARAKQIAQAIIDHYDQFGKPPTNKWLKERVYGHIDGGNMTAVTKQMVALGWLFHQSRRRADFALTGLGRAALFGQVDDQLHTDTPINPMERSIKEDGPEPFEEVARPAKPRPTIPRRVREPPAAFAPLNLPASYALAGHSDVDLVLELINRGFMVRR
jgi:hypothetical protein